MQNAEMVAELQLLLRRQVIAGWRSCGSKLLPCVQQWVRTRSTPWPMLCSKGPKKVEQPRGRCQEEMKEEGRVKMNKGKAGSTKVHRRAVWSFYLPRVRVHLAKAEVQVGPAHKGIAIEDRPDLQDGAPWMRKGMTIWEKWCLKQKRKKNSQGKDSKTFEENSQGRDPRSQGEDPRTGKRQLKGGESRKSGKKTSGKERTRKRRQK